jgi:hypothetical protein
MLVNEKVTINRATAVIGTAALSEIKSNRRTSLHGRNTTMPAAL